MTTTTIARVAKGVALLDDKLPGWRARIDLDTLDLGSAKHCIIGQLFASDDSSTLDYMRGCDELGIVGRDAEHGFDIDLDELDDDPFDHDDAIAHQRDDMQDAWEHAIAG